MLYQRSEDWYPSWLHEALEMEDCTVAQLPKAWLRQSDGETQNTLDSVSVQTS